MKAILFGLITILCWGSLATLGKLLFHLPPFYLLGASFLVGSLPGFFRVKKMFARPKILLWGVMGYFLYHFFLFYSFRFAPALEANLINYLWPLLLVLLAPLFIKTRLTLRQVLAAVIGFVGAALAIASGGNLSGGFEIGYLYAFAAAIIWATYSLMTKRLGNFSTASVGTFALVSGLLAVVGHFVLEPAAVISPNDWWLLLLMGLGPLGGAFYLWDYALKHGSAQRVGLISFATPLLSTTLLILTTGTTPSPLLLASAALIIGAAIMGRGEK